jgi:hypothetical protein
MKLVIVTERQHTVLLIGGSNSRVFLKLRIDALKASRRSPFSICLGRLDGNNRV